MIRAAGLILLAFGLALSGCGKKGDPKPPKREPVKTEETVSE